MIVKYIRIPASVLAGAARREGEFARLPPLFRKQFKLRRPGRSRLSRWNSSRRARVPAKCPRRFREDFIHHESEMSWSPLRLASIHDERASDETNSWWFWWLITFIIHFYYFWQLRTFEVSKNLKDSKLSSKYFEGSKITSNLRISQNFKLSKLTVPIFIFSYSWAVKIIELLR